MSQHLFHRLNHEASTNVKRSNVSQLHFLHFLTIRAPLPRRFSEHFVFLLELSALPTPPGRHTKQAFAGIECYQNHFHMSHGIGILILEWHRIKQCCYYPVYPSTLHHFWHWLSNQSNCWAWRGFTIFTPYVYDRCCTIQWPQLRN